MHYLCLVSRLKPEIKSPYKTTILMWSVNMTARENVVPVLLEKVYQLIQDKLELSHQPLVTKLAQHLFSNIADDDLIQRNESDLYGAVVLSLIHI